MHKKIRVFFLLLISLLVIPFSYGIGIGLGVSEIEFKPNLNEDYYGIVYNNVNKDIRVELSARGELGEYITFEKGYLDIRNGKNALFNFNVNLPEEIKPGINTILIGAKDVTPSAGGMISAKTAISAPLKIRAPYAGEFIEGSISAEDIGENGVVKFNIKITNRGTETIDKILGLVEIFNEEDRVGVLTLEGITNLRPDENKIITAKWDSKGNAEGSYKAKVTLNYGSNELIIDTMFRIGTLSVKIINYTQELYKDSINQFDIEFESFWNSKIKGIYGEIELGEEKVKTLPVDLAPFGKAKVIGYLDTHSIELGEHTVNMKIYYEDEVTEEIGKIMVLPKIELPSKVPSTTIMLTVVIALLVIGNVILVLFFLRRRNMPSQRLNSKKKKKK